MTSCGVSDTPADRRVAAQDHAYIDAEIERLRTHYHRRYDEEAFRAGKRPLVTLVAFATMLEVQCDD